MDRDVFSSAGGAGTGQGARGFSRRDFLAGVAATTAVGVAGLGGRPAAAGQAAGRGRGARRPNLLYVFTDQQSFDMVGCYGNDQLITPQMDGLAAQGLKFDHCVSSNPVCSPHRGMLISGQHPVVNGVLNNDMPLLYNTGTPFAQALKDEGYTTGYVGKWHLYGGNRDRPVPEGPTRFGFDYFYTNNCHVNYTPGQCFYWDDWGRKVYFPNWEVYGQTQQAIDFIDTRRQDEPWALFVSWHPPHDAGLQGGDAPFTYRYDTIDELMDLYDPAEIRLRPSVDPEIPGIRRAYHGHYAMTTGTDIALGALMAKLRERGMDENTLVVFTSDHGDQLHSHGRNFPKGVPTDLSTRVPMIMRMPGVIPEAASTRLPFGTLDIMPTVLALMGIEPPGSCDGRDLSQALLSGDEDAQDAVFLLFGSPQWRGVYTRDHVYAEGQARRRVMRDGRFAVEPEPADSLYDRNADPHQLNNLFGKPEAAGLQERLREKMIQEMARYEDGLDVGDMINEYRQRIRRGGDFERDARKVGTPLDVFRQMRERRPA